MADRSDEIFIYLKAIGAKKAARDIKNVADATKSLNESSDESIKRMAEERRLLEAQSKARNAETRAKNAETKAIHEESRATKGSTESIKENVKAKNWQSKIAVQHGKEIEKSIQDQIDALDDLKLSEENYNKEVRQLMAKRLVLKEKEKEEEEKRVAAYTKLWDDALKEDKKYTEEKSKLHKKETEDFEKNFNRQMRSVDNFMGVFKRASKENNSVIERTHALNEHIDKLTENSSKSRSKRLETEAKQLKKHTEAEILQLQKLRKARRHALGNVGRSILPDMSNMRNLRLHVALIGTVISAIPMIGTFFNALGAGAIALIGAFGQLSGVLGAIPAGLLAVTQGVSVFALAFGGLGKAMKDQNAFAELGPQAQNLVLALNNMRPAMKQIKRNVQEGLLEGLGFEIQSLSHTYLPMLNNALTKTAKLSNTALRNFTGWMGSQEGTSTIGGIADTNAVVVGQGVDAGQRLLQTFLLVANAAGPMLREMSADLVQFSHVINNWVSNNQNGIGSFFMRGYEMFKGALRTIGNFGMGFYNIIKLAAPLTEHITSSIAEAGIKFRAWTQSADGIDKIKKYFAEMRPNLDAVMHLAGAFATAIFQISRSDKFQEFVNTLAGTTIPAVAKALTAIADSGALTTLAELLGHIADAVTVIATGFAALPGFMQKAIIFGILFGGVIAKAAGIIKALFGLRGLGFAGSIGTGVRGLFGGGAAAGGAGIVGGGLGGGGAVAGGVGLTAAETAAGGYMLADGTKVVPDGKGGFVKSKPLTGAAKYAAADPFYTPKGEGSGKNGRLTAEERAYNRTSKNVTKFGVEKPGLATRIAPKAAAGAGVARGVGLAVTKVAGPIAIAAMVASILGPILGTNAKEQTPEQINKAIKDPTLKSFFTGKSSFGTPQIGQQGFGPLKTRNVTDIKSATGRLFDKSGYEKFKDWGVWSAISGGTSDDDKIRQMFGQIDAGLTQLNPKDAAAKFAVYEKQMKESGATTQEIIDLFPQYRAQIESTIDPMDKAGKTAEGLANKMAGAADQMKNKLNAQGIAVSANPNISSTSGPGMGVQVEGGSYFAGGLARGGTLNTVGELGPEVAINRAGQMSMVGMHGMEMFKPSGDTAIIPSSASFDPLNGNYGNTPLWAKDMYQGGSEGRLKVAPSPSSGGSGGGESVVYAPHVSVSSSNASPAEIEAAVGRAIRKADRDRRERR